MIPQLQREAPVSTTSDTTVWSLPTRIAFRFVFCYVLLYIYPRSIGSLGAGVKYSNPVRNLWHVLVPWVGSNILHVQGPFTEVANGSGDQIYDYVLLFCIAVIAAVATAVWSVVDRKRPNYRALYQWVRIVMRMVVSVAMFSYGLNKLFRMQFAEIGYARLVDTYGQTYPMGLLWAFMGYSHAYSFFAGVGETLGALLLVVPQFTVIGSLVTLAVMSNVLMLNLCYDVPRKIYSIHLIAMCLFLIMPDMWRMAELFLFNRKVQLTQPQPLFKDKQGNMGIWLLQLAIGIGAIIVCGNQAYQDQVKNETYVPAPLRGIWTVDQFALDNAPHPPLVTDTQRWRRVILDTDQLATIQAMDDTQERYYFQLDATRRLFTLWELAEPHRHANFSYENSDADRMALTGSWFDGHQINADLKRMDLKDPEKFRLMDRGFHWVTDYPHNR
ncbi:MAG: hypothetical protein WA655_07650 [Candidatus Korobacteraceae bacterium]